MTMVRTLLERGIVTVFLATVLIIGSNMFASAHCDTMDGPVVQDARKALGAQDVTPVLKWIQAKDEKTVKDAFDKALAARGNKQQAAEMKFFETLVKIHRAGEGEHFAGLKHAGEVEAVIAEADKALAGGSPDALAKLLTDAISQGIRQRYEKTAEAFRHKDESVQKGREYVAAYVEYTHYVERLHMDAQGHVEHHDKTSSAKAEHAHGK